MSICMCHYCGEEIDWESAGRGGLIWQCENDDCEKFFCSKCFEDNTSIGIDKCDEDILCPDCFKIIKMRWIYMKQLSTQIRKFNSTLARIIKDFEDNTGDKFFVVESIEGEVDLFLEQNILLVRGANSSDGYVYENIGDLYNVCDYVNNDPIINNLIENEFTGLDLVQAKADKHFLAEVKNMLEDGPLPTDGAYAQCADSENSLNVDDAEDDLDEEEWEDVKKCIEETEELDDDEL